MPVRETEDKVAVALRFVTVAKVAHRLVEDKVRAEAVPINRIFVPVALANQKVVPEIFVPAREIEESEVAFKLVTVARVVNKLGVETLRADMLHVAVKLDAVEETIAYPEMDEMAQAVADVAYPDKEDKTALVQEVA